MEFLLGLADGKFLAILVVVIAICSTTTVFAVNLSDTHDFDCAIINFMNFFCA